jgi:hypothetical protein
MSCAVSWPGPGPAIDDSRPAQESGQSTVALFSLAHGFQPVLTLVSARVRSSARVRPSSPPTPSLLKSSMVAPIGMGGPSVELRLMGAMRAEPAIQTLPIPVHVGASNAPTLLKRARLLMRPLPADGGHDFTARPQWHPERDSAGVVVTEAIDQGRSPARADAGVERSAHRQHRQPHLASLSELTGATASTSPALRPPGPPGLSGAAAIRGIASRVRPPGGAWPPWRPGTRGSHGPRWDGRPSQRLACAPGPRIRRVAPAARSPPCKGVSASPCGSKRQGQVIPEGAGPVNLCVEGPALLLCP